MTSLGPLRFRPLYRRYVWGGRRLGTHLGKPIGPEADYAECWELVDREADQSVVAAGPLAGVTLHALVTGRREELLGRHAPQPRFPLLFKWLDVESRTSVQVHPTDDEAARLVPPDLGKTEAWYFVDVRAGSRAYAGLRRGFDRAAFARELNRGTGPLCLHAFEPHPGQALLVPAGAVHALGEGLLVAEIQQSSDVTWRLDDWGRVGSDGRSRTLHVDEGLAAINDRLGPLDPTWGTPTARPECLRLAACPQFVFERWRLDGPLPLGEAGRFTFLAVVDGTLRLAGDDAPFQRGQTVLLPASLGPVEAEPIAGPATVLAVYLP